MKKKLMYFIFLTFFLFPLNIFAIDNGYYIENYNVKIDVKEDNKLEIEETLDVNFLVPRHGIIRDIPLETTVKRVDGTQEKRKIKIKKMNISDPFESNYQNGVQSYKIGSASQTITGGKTYVFKYVYDMGPEFNQKDFDELYFNIIGIGWDTYINHASFEIKMPKDFDTSKIGFSSGSYGTVGTNHIKYEVNNNVIKGSLEERLNAYQGLTIRVELPSDYFNRESLSYIPYGISIGMSVFFSLLAIVLWFKYGKDDDPVEVVEFNPPEGFNSLEIAYIYKLGCDNKDAVSLLIYLAGKGYLTVEDKGKKDFVIKKVKDYDGNNESERIFFNGLFKNGDTVSKSDLQESFYTTLSRTVMMISKLKSTVLENSRVGKRLFILLFTIINLVTVCAGLIFDFAGFESLFMFGLLIPVLILCLVQLGVFNNKFNYISLGIDIFFILMFSLLLISLNEHTPLFIPCAISLFIYLVIAVICYIFMEKRSKKGNELYGKILGFKRFIETAEKSKLEALVEQTPSYFYLILPFAYVLGVSNKWIKKFEDIDMPKPDWYQGYGDATTVMALNRNLNSLVSSVSTAMVSTPAPSSSSYSGGGFSGGGGGFSGGGFGGGGGSSW